MILFWVVAGVISAAAAGLILQRAARAASTPEAVDPTLGLYRRQLTEIDELAERGLLPAAERRSAHAEAARRLLGAEGRGEAWLPTASMRGPVLAAAILVPAAALALYLATGSPGAGDQPYAGRMKAWRAADPAVLSPPEMAAVIEVMTKERPRDPEAFRYLALAEAAADNPAEAVRALRKAVTLAPARADLWEALGEATLMESGGDVTPQAAVAFREALARDPKSMAARFHLARAQLAAGDRAGAVAAWRSLLADMPGEDPRRGTVQAAIDTAQGRPPAPAAPPQIAAIRGMVAGLAARLQAQPDDPDGWVRLVRSYAVLGQAAERDAALKAARARYAARPDVLDALKAAAATEPMR